MLPAALDSTAQRRARTAWLAPSQSWTLPRQPPLCAALARAPPARHHAPTLVSAREPPLEAPTGDWASRTSANWRVFSSVHVCPNRAQAMSKQYWSTSRKRREARSAEADTPSSLANFALVAAPPVQAFFEPAHDAPPQSVCPHNHTANLGLPRGVLGRNECFFLAQPFVIRNAIAQLCISSAQHKVQIST